MRLTTGTDSLHALLRLGGKNSKNEHNAVPRGPHSVTTLNTSDAPQLLRPYFSTLPLMFRKL